MKLKKRDYIVLGGIIFMLLVALVVTLFVLNNAQQAELQNSPAGKALFASSTPMYTDLLGNKVDLNSYIGKQLVVFVWASWCPSCSVQLQTLRQLASERSDVAFLAINRAESVTTVERFINYVQMDTSGPILFLLDPQDHFYQSVGGYAMPETVIFDETGAITSYQRGDVSRGALEAALTLE